MSFANVTVDLTTLPVALLPIAKEHCRIDGNFEDAQLQRIIAWAISTLEQKDGMRLNEISYEWQPEPNDLVNGGARIPYPVVTAFTASDGTNDLTAEYTLRTLAIDGAIPQYLDGASFGGIRFAMSAGYPDAASIPQHRFKRLMLNIGHLFEHRELLLPGQAYVSPDLALDGTDWLPRV
jgi:hypothetical protein